MPPLPCLLFLWETHYLSFLQVYSWLVEHNNIPVLAASCRFSVTRTEIIVPGCSLLKIQSMLEDKPKKRLTLVQALQVLVKAKAALAGPNGHRLRTSLEALVSTATPGYQLPAEGHQEPPAAKDEGNGCPTSMSCPAPSLSPYDANIRPLVAAYSC